MCPFITPIMHGHRINLSFPINTLRYESPEVSMCNWEKNRFRHCLISKDVFLSFPELRNSLKSCFWLNNSYKTFQLGTFILEFSKCGDNPALEGMPPHFLFSDWNFMLEIHHKMKLCGYGPYEFT